MFGKFESLCRTARVLMSRSGGRGAGKGGAALLKCCGKCASEGREARDSPH